LLAFRNISFSLTKAGLIQVLIPKVIASMKVSISPVASAQSRQVRQRLANPDESLSYELGKAVQELPPLYTRLLAGGISLLVFGTIAWAALSKVDEVAIAPGEVIPSAQVRPVHALSPGSIQQINVKEGQIITKGEVLIAMDPSLPQTDVDRLEKSAKLIREDIARLQTESDGGRGTGAALQNQLLDARLKEFDNKRDSAIAEANRQSAAADEAKVLLSRLQENLINAETSLSNAQERERSLRSLLASNVVPRLDYIDAKDRVTGAEDKVISLKKEINGQQERIRQSLQAVEGAQSTAEGVGSQRKSEILTQMTKRKEELTTIEGQLASAKQQRQRETIEAPFDGTVYNVKATRGPVQSGEELLSILPKGEDILLEVKVLNRDIGFIREGMKAKIKLATFPFQEFGIVDGEVVKVSPNAVTEKDKQGQELGPVFPTRIRLNRHTLMVHGKPVELTPGMTASAEIVTRQKTILTFLIEPVTRRFSEAFSVR